MLKTLLGVASLATLWAAGRWVAAAVRLEDIRAREADGQDRGRP